ncbi:MAG TPA: TonB-dependent receptor [Draconibacterium sp.]|nr:TonB-dependent receptor [Draconibacterium sp.]
MKRNLYVMLLLFSMLIFNQTKADDTPKIDDDRKGKISGVILDEATSQPMEFANVAVYNEQDSTLITGTITDVHGKFEIDGVNYGDYFVEANFMGFEKRTIADVELNSDNKNYDLGTIDLSPASMALGEVNVVADKAPVEYKLDKKVVNVSQVISAVGGTAVDVLENTPSVQVDIDGNVSLRGSSNFTVLIDGRPSVLSGSDALQQIPSSAIENIEIITNPSAKYEPDGTAGIINLVMKKNSMNGLNGIVNASVGSGDKYRGDFMLNYRFNKINIFAGADWRDETNYGKMMSERETYTNDTTQYLNMNGKRNMIRGGNTIKGGADLFLGKATTLTLSGELGKSKRGSSGGGRTENFTIPATEHIYSVTDETSDRINDFYTLNANFQHKFDDKGHRIEASAFYSDENGTDTEIESELLADPNFIPANEYLSKISSLETEDQKEFRFKLDYTYPFSENGRLEAGMQSRIEDQYQTMEFRDYNQATDSWIINNDFTSATDFRRDIHAVYGTFSNKLGKFEYMAGLRGELTLREIKNTNADQASKLNRFDFFPTVHVSYPLAESIEFTTSYSRRINRPRGWDLDPSPNYFNRYTIRYGNPDLKPEYTNSYEMGMMKRFGSGRTFISADLFHRVTNNKIDRVETLGNDGVFYMRTDNFDKDYSTGLEVTGNISIQKWLVVNANVNMFHYRITGDLNGVSIDRESTNWGGRLNTTLKFSENSRLQLTGFFRGPSVTAQGNSKSMFFSNVSYRQEFMKNKLSATVSVRDPLGTAKFRGENFGDNFSNRFTWEREPRVVMLTLSYKINNFKEDKNGNRGNDSGMDMQGGGEF